MAIVRVDRCKDTHRNKEDRCSLKFYVAILYYHGNMFTYTMDSGNKCNMLKVGESVQARVFISGRHDNWIQAGRTVDVAYRKIIKTVTEANRTRAKKNKFAVKLFRLGSKNCPVVMVKRPKHIPGTTPEVIEVMLK